MGRPGAVWSPGSTRLSISVRRSWPTRAGGRQVPAPLRSVAPLRGRHATPRSSRWVIGWGGFHGGTAVWPGTFSHGGTDFRLGGLAARAVGAEGQCSLGAIAGPTDGLGMAVAPTRGRQIDDDRRPALRDHRFHLRRRGVKDDLTAVESST